jgi:hypothetical protein
MSVTKRVTAQFNLLVSPAGLAYFNTLTAANRAFLINGAANQYYNACDLAARMDALA